MEATLKALKVPELKVILTQANLPVGGKKDELIQRILDSPPALEAAQKLHGQSGVDAIKDSVAASTGPIEEENLMPPDEFDWGDDGKIGADEVATTSASITANGDVLSNVVQSTPTQTTPSKAAQSASDAPAASNAMGSTAHSSNATNTQEIASPQAAPPKGPTPEELEIERLKRQKRAERFGVVEPQERPSKKPKTKTEDAIVPSSEEDASKVEARAAKFGSVETEEEKAAKAAKAKELEEKRMAQALQRLEGPLGMKSPNRPPKGNKALSKSPDKSTKSPAKIAPAPASTPVAKPQLSAEEEEKRRKRAERFGTTAQA